MSASASSSSRWRTPTDDSSRGGPQSAAKRLEGGHTLNLQDQVQDFPQNWTTPSASDAHRGVTITDAMSGTSLVQQVNSRWPTPSAHEARVGFQQRPEGMASEQNQQSLSTVAMLWSSPRASDREKGSPNQSFISGGTPLPAQAIRWPTATSLSYGESHQPGNSRSYNLTMELAEPISSLQDPLTYEVGQVSSHPRRSLNPLFVEWLMGWPPGWTLLAWTDFACSATALYAFRQHMRSALLQLGFPPTAPREQLSLFA